MLNFYPSSPNMDISSERQYSPQPMCQPLEPVYRLYQLLSAVAR